MSRARRQGAPVSPDCPPPHTAAPCGSEDPGRGFSRRSVQPRGAGLRSSASSHEMHARGPGRPAPRGSGPSLPLSPRVQASLRHSVGHQEAGGTENQI